MIGIKDRETNTVKATVIENTDRMTLSGFVTANVEPGTKVYTDEHSGYNWVLNREVVRHGVKEYVREQAHTNGIESFWSMLKRGYVGTYHQMSVKHLDRYVNEFAGRVIIPDLWTRSYRWNMSLGGWLGNSCVMGI